VNYIRNSVKIVTDAYDGTIAFYVADENDPVIRSYRRIFPAMWQPLASMPPSVRAHVRYPETLFAIQARMYGVYHTGDPATYYNRSDVWQVAPEPNLSGGTRMRFSPLMPPGAPVMGGAAPGEQPAQLMEPYYVTMRLPGEKQEEFLLILPMNFRDKPNMASWLTARSDGENYGELIAYVFPRGTQTTGPTQVAAFINQDSAIAQQLTLWNQQGSTVIWGNLLVMPIERSLLYVVPLFLSAAQGGIPELRRVILFHSGRVVMEPTLAEAIRVLFQEAPSEEQVTVSAGTAAGASPGARAPTTVPPRMRALADAAARQLDQASQAQRRGDWAAYGEALKRLEGTLRELRRTAGTGP
jgi:uncharacterized membrane protein (UPF0182 family)